MDSHYIFFIFFLLQGFSFPFHTVVVGWLLESTFISVYKQLPDYLTLSFNSTE